MRPIITPRVRGDPARHARGSAREQEPMTIIQVRYFASLREALGTDAESLPAEPGTRTVAAVREQLRRRGGAWAEALAADRRVLAAVNQEMARPESAVSNGDEVAFFPPVTGG